MLNFIKDGRPDQELSIPRMPDNTFSKQLRWHIGEAKHALFMTIAPTNAAVMMERNTDEDYRNRPLADSTVRRYARAMKEERWVETGEPIIFSSDGVLLNGQHRLAACIVSGHPFTTLVVFGIDRAAFKFMDRGLKRTAAHVYSIEGIANAALMAAAIVWVDRIENRNGFSRGADDRLENEQILELYYQHERIQESAWVSRKIKSEGNDIISNSLLVALHYLMSRRSREAADEFVNKLITGVGIVRADEPERALRRWLDKDNKNTARTADVYRAAYVVMAWNARRSNRPLKMFRWRTEQTPNAPFPAIR